MEHARHRRSNVRGLRQRRRVAVAVALASMLVVIGLAAVLFMALSPLKDFVIWHSFEPGSAQAAYIEGVALPAVEREHKGVKATAVYYREEDMLDELLRARNEGTLPDVVILSSDAMAALAQLGVLVPLDGVDGLEGLSGPRSLTAGAGAIEGNTYGIVTDASVQVLVWLQDHPTGT